MLISVPRSFGRFMRSAASSTFTFLSMTPLPIVTVIRILRCSESRSFISKLTLGPHAICFHKGASLRPRDHKGYDQFSSHGCSDIVLFGKFLRDLWRLRTSEGHHCLCGKQPSSSASLDHRRAGFFYKIWHQCRTNIHSE